MDSIFLHSLSGADAFVTAIWLAAIVAAYLMLKSRWKSIGVGRKALKGAALLALALAIGICTSLAIDRWNDRPQIVTAINGVAIGDRMADAKFLVGEMALSPANDSFGPSNEKRHYSNKAGLGTISRDEIIFGVLLSCEVNQNRYERVGGISCGANGEEIKSRYQSDVRVLCHKDQKKPGWELFRAYDAPSFGVRYILETNKVVAIYIFAPEELKKLAGFNWDQCP